MLIKNAVILSCSLFVATLLIGCGQDGSAPQTAAEKSDSAADPSKDQSAADWTSVTLHIDGFKKSKSGAT